MPGATVNVSPTVNVPDNVGVPAVVNGRRATATVALATDFITEVYAALMPVTSSLMNLSASSGFNRYVRLVASDIAVNVPVAVSALFHTYSKRSCTGAHVPSLAVRTWPTFTPAAGTVIVGTGVVVKAPRPIALVATLTGDVET